MNIASRPVGKDFVPYPVVRRVFPVTLPTLTQGREAHRHGVVIAGAGPVGLTLALGLAAQGVKVVILEADDGVCTGSRAICFSRRSLEIFERLGVLHEVLALSLPWTGGRSFYRDDEVLHFHMPHDAQQKLPPMVNVAQYDIESILVNRAMAMPELIDIRWGSKVTGLERLDNKTRLDVQTAAGNYGCEADWLVACDGARSTVRDALGLRMQGTRYEGQYIIVDILMKSDRPTERLAYFDPSCNRGSTVLVHKQPNHVWRIDYQLREGEDPIDAVKPEHVLPRVQCLLDMMGEGAPWSPIWISLYRASALTLERYVHGRVLFAGDAAHLMPIFGVRGANSGIDDADNLAWKLAWVAKGLAPSILLESYSQERSAAARENMRLAMKSTEFMAPPSFAFDLMRTAALGLARDDTRLRSLINPRQTAPITYFNSSINANAEQFNNHAGPVPGSPLIECRITLNDVEGHLSDLLQGGLTALWFSKDGQDDSAPFATLRASLPDGLNVRWVHVCGQDTPLPAQVHDTYGDAFVGYGVVETALYLVRPDGHVWGRWFDLSLDQACIHIRACLEAVGVPL